MEEEEDEKETGQHSRVASRDKEEKHFPHLSTNDSRGRITFLGAETIPFSVKSDGGGGRSKRPQRANFNERTRGKKSKSA